MILIPTIQEAEKILNEGARMNPGRWVWHSRVAGMCAGEIAVRCGLNMQRAYALAILHDIGRRYGKCQVRHIVMGYEYLSALGYELAARVCLTHSFPYQNPAAYTGENDCTPKETQIFTQYIEKVEYNDYDRLIQLCDGISMSSGAVTLEQRRRDVEERYGINEYTEAKWNAYHNLKTYFDEKCGQDIYEFLLKDSIIYS